MKTATDDLQGRLAGGARAGHRRAAAGPAAPALRRRSARPRAAAACRAGWPASWSASASSARCPPSSTCCSTRSSGWASGPQVANALAPAASPPSPTRRPTGGSPSGYAAGTGAVRHQAQGLVVFGIGLALTSGSLAALDAADRRPRARHRTGRADRRQPRRDRAALPALPRLGLPARRREDAVPNTTAQPEQIERPARSRGSSREPPPRRLPDDASSADRTSAWPTARSQPSPAWPASAARPPPGRPRWARPAFLGLLAADQRSLYLWSLGASGYANSFYSAAVQAGSESWKAFFFGSLDAGERHHRRQAARPRCGRWRCRCASSASARWQILVPEALMGVATVGVLYAAVRRRFGPAAGSDRGRGARADARRRADVPLQQPGRAARPADARAPSTACCAPLEDARTKWLVLGRRRVRLRVPRQDPAGLPDPAAAGPRVRGLRAGVAAAAARAAAARGARDGGRRRLVGRDRRAVAARPPARTSAARRTTASWS